MNTTTATLLVAMLAAFSGTASAQTGEEQRRRLVPVNIGGMTCTLYVYKPMWWKETDSSQRDRFGVPLGIQCPQAFKLVEGRMWLTKNGTDYHQDPTIFYTYSYQESPTRAYTDTSLSCSKKPAQPINWFGTGYITIRYNGVNYRSDATSDPAPLLCDFP